MSLCSKDWDLLERLSFQEKQSFQDVPQKNMVMTGPVVAVIKQFFFVQTMTFPKT